MNDEEKIFLRPKSRSLTALPDNFDSKRNFIAPPHEEDLIQAVYHKYAKTKKGTMDFEMFKLFLANLGQHININNVVHSFTDAPIIFLYLDKNADGVISYEEFCSWWATSEKYSLFVSPTLNLLKQAHTLFTKYTNNHGSMTTKQFSHFVEGEYTGHVNDRVFDVIDTDDDGLISFYEFCTWLKWF
jgi:Ca2+-binding EF-hand superfamily protein